MPTAAISAPTKGAQTRRAILDAAIRRFGREGFRAASVADIARDAKVGATVTYAYFADKEALFLAALDEDAAAVITEALAAAFEQPDLADWRETLFFTMVDAVEHHPLARRLLAGLEPDVTDRVLEIPALAELRKTCAERLRAEQASGAARLDIDPVTIGNGIVAIMLALLMAVVQVGVEAAGPYTRDVAAVFDAAVAIDRAPTTVATRRRSRPRQTRPR
jgi:AcrR family transcriptional regulator